MKIYAIGLGSLICMLTPAMASPIVADGDFINNYNSYYTFNAGQTLESGNWTVTTGSVTEVAGGGSVDEIGGYWQAPTIITDSGSVDLDGNSPGGIEQTIDPSAGRYLLSFYLSGNPDGGDPLKTVTVDVGATSDTHTYTTGSNTHTDMDYVEEALPFSTSGGDIILSFTSDDLLGSYYGPVIGAVDITALPEPSSFPMLLAGLGLIGGAFYFGRKNVMAVKA